MKTRIEVITIHEDEMDVNEFGSKSPGQHIDEMIEAHLVHGIDGALRMVQVTFDDEDRAVMTGRKPKSKSRAS